MKVQNSKSKIIIVLSSPNPNCPRMIVSSSKNVRVRDDFGGDMKATKKLVSKLGLL